MAKRPRGATLTKNGKKFRVRLSASQAIGKKRTPTKGLKSGYKGRGPGSVVRSALEAAEELGRGPIDVLQNMSPGSGRRPLFQSDPLFTKSLLRLLSRGYRPTLVCGQLGIAYTTFTEWLTRGAKGEAPYAGFLMKVYKAVAKSEQAMIERLRKHNKDDWRSIAWELERRWPGVYGKQVFSKHEHHVEGSVTLERKQELANHATDETSRDSVRDLIEGVDYTVVR